MSDEQDSLLIEQARAGKAGAFDALLGRHRNKLLWAIRRIVQDSHDAEDVLQEASICIFRALGRYRGDARFSTWIYRIAVNCALQCVARNKHNGAHVAQLSESDGEVALCPGPDDILFGTQMVSAVGSVLDEMRPEYRAAMLLHQFDGLSYDQISGVMRCPVGTVRSRIFTARHLIASNMQKRGFSVGAA